jgi:mannose-1-phosphate guanylyltransferase/mannose-6-phosphate isomerase
MSSYENFTMIMPCDHVIDDDEFIKVYLSSLKYLNNSIITFGIKPTYAETGFGYIKTDNNLETIKFVEKPNKATANEYLKGNYLWNAGIFLFKNENMIKCFEKYESGILHKCQEIIAQTDLTKSPILLDNLFIECRSVSIDYAIMEPLCNDTNIIGKKTIPYDGHWNDIGSFSSLYDELDKDENNNIINGDIKTILTTNCYIESKERFVSTIGVNNLIIIDTLDALLICNKDNTQDVKKIVDSLKENKREEAYFHKTVIRPWGFYKNIEGNDINGFKVKKIVVFPGKRLSLQSHNFRSEHWVIVKGSAKVTLGTETFYLNTDNYIYIPIKTLHRIENVGESLLEFTETQVGNYLGEDDIIRYQDDFGRI